MSLKARRELHGALADRYRDAGRAEKGRILDEFTAATGYHRKYAIQLLSRHGPPLASTQVRRPRPRKYASDIEAVLVTIWETANRICSKRLVPFLPELVEAMERGGYLDLTEEQRATLLGISPATVDRLLARIRRTERARGLTTTRSGSLLKRNVPIRTFFDWDDLRPGFIEADLVAHCGTTMAGSFVNTLVMTDVATGWTECGALPYRSQDLVLRALKAGAKRLPVRLRGLDTDNGSEFLNHTVIEYCREQRITFTRSRAYRKNDQAHVEEKNGSVVRRMVGYDRYEGVVACRALSRLYGALRLYVNFFQPSMKLISKEREDGA